MTCGISMRLAAQDQPAPKTTQPAASTATQPGPAAAPASPAAPKAAGSKAAPRRNEKSGASALLTLEQARDKLISYQSVSAGILETVVIGERRFRIKGRYLQGTELRLRLEYELETGGTKGRLVEVCDGQILWTHQILGKDQRVMRRDVREIIAAAAAKGTTPQNLLTAELGLGGLPGLVASIQKSVAFDRQWEQDVDQKPLVVIEGPWKQTFRERFLGAKAPADAPLPAYVPDKVRLYLDSESLFPKRVLYLKRDAGGVHHPMVALDFVDVQWNGPIDEKQFTFTPPEGVTREDVTQAYVNLFKEPAAPPAAGPNSEPAAGAAPATTSPAAKANSPTAGAASK